MAENVTIDDIARTAGVGKGTVDRVLHNRGYVSLATREKVLKCIEELDYKPNMVARMLAKTRSYRVAVCFHDKEREFWDQVKTGIHAAAEQYKQMGVEIVPFLLPEINIEKQLEVIRYVSKEKFDGLAIVPYCSPQIREELNRAVENGMQVITFNNRESGVNACYVGINGIQSGRTAGRMISMIAGRGARYVIVSGHSNAMANLDERAMGFREVIENSRPDMKFVGSCGIEEDYDRIYRFVLRNMEDWDPDVLYATNECVSAVGRAIAELKPKKKIYVIGHDFTPAVLEYMRDGIIDISIGQDPERQGYSAVDKICRKLLTDEQITDEFLRISIAVAENIDYLN